MEANIGRPKRSHKGPFVRYRGRVVRYLRACPQKGQGKGFVPVMVPDDSAGQQGREGEFWAALRAAFGNTWG